MDLNKLNPWNWFKHELGSEQPAQVPVKRSEYRPITPSGGQPLETLHREFDRLLEGVLQRWQRPPSGRPGSGELFPTLGGDFTPRLNIAAEEKRYRVSVELPGLREEDVELEVSGDLLVIKGRSDVEQEDKGTHYYRIERASGRFQRALSLPEDADAGGIQASLKNGVLDVEIPRKDQPARPGRRIPIRGGEAEGMGDEG